MYVYARRLIVICDYPDTSILKITFWSSSAKHQNGTNLCVREKAISFTPEQGLCPWTPLRASPQTSVKSSRSRVRYGLQLPQSKFVGYIAGETTSFPVSFNMTGVNVLLASKEDRHELKSIRVITWQQKWQYHCSWAVRRTSQHTNCAP